jgi:hypothetical protein
VTPFFYYYFLKHSFAGCDIIYLTVKDTSDPIIVHGNSIEERELNPLFGWFARCMFALCHFFGLPSISLSATIDRVV